MWNTIKCIISTHTGTHTLNDKYKGFPRVDLESLYYTVNCLFRIIQAFLLTSVYASIHGHREIEDIKKFRI